jgi:hypothetical protein
MGSPAAAAEMSRIERDGKYLAIHARQLAIQSRIS